MYVIFSITYVEFAYIIAEGEPFYSFLPVQLLGCHNYNKRLSCLVTDYARHLSGCVCMSVGMSLAGDTTDGSADESHVVYESSSTNATTTHHVTSGSNSRHHNGRLI